MIKNSISITLFLLLASPLVQAQVQTNRGVDPGIRGVNKAEENVKSDSPPQGGPPTLKTYSKFDFVPGDRVTALEDFALGETGDFPARWNSNGSGELITIEGQAGRWLQLNDATLAFPEFVKNLPDNFTLEFTMAANPNPDPAHRYTLHYLSLLFTPETEAKSLFAHRNNFMGSGNVVVAFCPQTGGQSNVDVWDMVSRNPMIRNKIATPKFSFKNQKSTARVSVWRQKTRLRVYLDDEKIWDIPQAFAPEASYHRLAFQVAAFGKGPYYLSDLRLAEGAPDTRNKLLTEGRFVTTGIGFDTNSDRIKPESFGSLKQIAEVLGENPAVRVRIIGHTDSDGDAPTNLDLSKRRAAAVRAALTNQFGVNNSRLETDGRGETQPVSPNTTAEGKANNRRVEFVKL